MKRLSLTLLLLLGSLPFGCDAAAPEDGGLFDGGVPDTGTTQVDAGTADAGTDAGTDDAGTTDAGTTDAGTTDAGTTDAGTAGEIDALFIGNSYTDSNNLPGMVQQALESLAMPPSPLTLNRATGGGRRLVQHSADAMTDGHALEAALSEGTLTHVILQEQSQIPGFPEGNATFESSKAAAFELAQLADARGARVLMYVTWGRRNGDDTNPGLFPDFTAMQNRLDAGYASLAAEADRAGAEVAMAPVGPAFRMIYEEDIATGDPLDPSALFFRLYSGDGSHPSVLGTYLAACVFVAAMLDVAPTDITFVPGGIDAGDALRIRQTAARAVEAL